MGTHPIFESDFDCLTDVYRCARELGMLHHVVGGIMPVRRLSLLSQFNLFQNNVFCFPSAWEYHSNDYVHK